MRDLFGETFQTVSFDFPWPETGGGKVKRGCDRHYPVIKSIDAMVDVVRSCPHWDRVAEHAHGYFWTTNRFLVGGDYSDESGPAWAPEIVRRLGFRPVTLLTWAKMEPAVEVQRCGDSVQLYAKGQAGIGQYFRGETEQLLFAVRGDGMALRRRHTERRDLGTLLPAPVPRVDGKRIHSRKPPESYALIEAASPGPYLEVFARVKHGPLWTPWGLDAPEAP